MASETIDGVRRAAALVAAAATFAVLVPAQAKEFDTGNPELSLRWDNTLRYNAGMRVGSRDSKIGNSIIADEGTYSFDKGDVVTSRVDLLTELDVVWRKSWGMRISAAGWYDPAYGRHSKGNPALVVPDLPASAPFPPLRQALPNGGRFQSYDDGRYSAFTKRFYRGPSGELLDAFAFGRFDLGEVPVNFKVGRHTVYWGESLLLGGAIHGIAYSQMPLDFQKGLATPGTSAKELFRPLGNVSAQARVTDTLSVAGQYFFEWQPSRFPEGGTYLGPVDFLFNGPDRQIVPQALGPGQIAFLNLARGTASEPRNHGEWGVAARWSPDWLEGGTIGLYAREFADKLPQVLVTSLSPVPTYFNTIGGTTFLALNGEYRLIYPDRIKLFGASLATKVGSVSVGAEFSYRRNMALVAQTLGNAAGASFDKGDTPGPRGDTLHGVVNLVGVTAQTPLFDTMTWIVEGTWSQWLKVRSGENLFNAVGFAPCAGKDKWDDCATRNYAGVAVTLAPTWFQVFPGANLSMPIAWSHGVYGNAAVNFGGNQGNGTYSVGLGLDFRNQYRFDLAYVDFYGRYRDDGNAVTSQNGATTLLKDRGFVVFTFRTTF